MPPAGFQPIIPASERQQNRALDCADTGIGEMYCLMYLKYSIFIKTVKSITIYTDERQRPTQPTDPSSQYTEGAVTLNDPPIE
jgi:hypothetical protein